MTRTFYEFFAGGGMARISLGPSRLCTFANDIDAGKGAVYRANFGADELKVCDAASITPADLPGRADLAWASPPCQDLFEAGTRAGLNGKRSGAFWPFWRLIKELNIEDRAPLTIVLENVTGLVTSHSGQDIAAIRAAFELEGYAHATAVIDAARFVPQSRERVFVIGARQEMGVDIRRLVEQALAALPLRNIDLVDVLENGSHLKWRPPQDVVRHLAMMAPVHLEKVTKARAAGRPIVGLIYRVMRPRTVVRGVGPKAPAEAAE
jgi:DNA (cytosine-5)-methyltransferase 1